MNHGTRTAYTYYKCRCDDCRGANRAYALIYERRRRRISYGIEDEPADRYVDASEARHYLQKLRNIGIGTRTVCQVTGLGRSTVQNVWRGGRAERRTIELILAVNATHAPPVAFIPATRTLAQIDDLIAAGYTKKRLGEYVHRNPNALTLQVNKRRVQKQTADRINALWQRVMAPEITRKEQEAARKRAERRRRAA
jgi:hypothetical protein